MTSNKNYRVGFGGEIAILWQQSVNLFLISYSSHHVDIMIKTDNGLWWQITSVMVILRLI